MHFQIFDFYLLLEEIFGMFMGCTPGSKSSFLSSVNWNSPIANRLGRRNVLNWKSKLSPFQNTQNYWKPLIIQKVMKKNVSDFDDKKMHAFIQTKFLLCHRSELEILRILKIACIKACHFPSSNSITLSFVTF